MTETIKDFYSDLYFPGRYTSADLEVYEEGFSFNLYLNEINRLMKDGIEVLDVGCGTGLVSNLFALRYPNAKFTSVDFSNSIDYATSFADENGINNVTWVKKDFLKFKSNKKFDLIICCGVLHHIPAYEEALDKMKNLMKVNGHLSLALYNPLGKILKRIMKIRYNSPTLYVDQEMNPFELSFTRGAVLNMCNELTFERVQPSICNHLVNFLSLFNSANGGLAIYTFRK
jgi:ubiquinone/menaquinone biosynthesis C-methylase UbiE